MAASGVNSSRPAEPLALALLAAGALAVFACSWALLHAGFYTRDRIVDTPVYQRYGDAIADGAVPYRDVRPEYPPAALPAFVVPAWFEDYDAAFDRLMAVFGAGAIALSAVALGALRASPVRAAAVLGFLAVWPLALGSVVLSRYDLWPAALTVGALAALLAGRSRLGAGVLALAAAAKVYPAVLAPLVAVWLWRREGPRAAALAAAAFLGVLALAFVPFAILAPEGLAESLGRQLSRPLQIESLAAAALVVAHNVAGLGVEMVGSHGSQNVGGLLGDAAGVASTAVQGGAVLALWIAFARGPATPDRLVRYGAATLLAFVALGKVLSPQFLVWLVPLVPLVAGRRGLAASGLLGAALVLTQIWFPFRYWDYAREFDGTVAWIVLARDLVLVACLAVLAWPAQTGTLPPPLGRVPSGRVRGSDPGTCPVRRGP